MWERYQSPFLSLYEFWCLHVERTRASRRWLPVGAVCTAAVLHTPSVGSLTSPPWSLENSGREMCVVRRGDKGQRGEGAGQKVKGERGLDKRSKGRGGWTKGQRGEGKTSNAMCASKQIFMSTKLSSNLYNVRMNVAIWGHTYLIVSTVTVKSLRVHVYEVRTDCGEERPVVGYCQNGWRPCLRFGVKGFMGCVWFAWLLCMLSRLQMCIYGKAIEQQYGTLNTIYNQIMCEGGAKGTPPLHFQVTSHTYTTLGCHMTWGISLLTKLSSTSTQKLSSPKKAVIN